jgi:hypothetical protein
MRIHGLIFGLLRREQLAFSQMLSARSAASTPERWKSV